MHKLNFLNFNKTGLTKNDEMRGEKGKKSAAYLTVCEHFFELFNKAVRVLRKSCKKELFHIALAFAILAIFGSAFADSPPAPVTCAANSLTIGCLAQNITASLGSIAKLITALSYVAGFGFAGAGVLKFKAHKENPNQAPLGVAFAMLIVGILMIYLPGVFDVTGRTIFNSVSEVGGVAGVTSFS